MRSCVRPFLAAHDRWPRWDPRSSPKHFGDFDKPVHQAGSLDRRFDRASSHSALSPRHQRAVQSEPSGCRQTATRVIATPPGWAMLVTAPTAERLEYRQRASRCSLTVQAVRRLTPLMPPSLRWWHPGAGIPLHVSSAPTLSGPSCWQAPRRRLCVACAAAEPATTPSSVGCPVSSRP